MISHLNAEDEVAQAARDLAAAIGSDDSSDALAAFINRYDRCQSDPVQVMLAEAMAAQFYELLGDEFEGDFGTEFESRLGHAVALCDYMFAYFSDDMSHSSGAHYSGDVFEGRQQLAIHQACSMVLYDTCEALSDSAHLDQQLVYYARHADFYAGHTDLQIQQQNAECFFFLGISYGQLKQHDKAMETYKAMLAHHGRSENAEIRELCAKTHINIAGVHFEQGRPEASIETYHQLIDSAPTPLPHYLYDPVSMAYVCLVDDYYGLGRLEDCEAMAEKAQALLAVEIPGIIEEQLEKCVALNFMLWCVDDQKHSLETVLEAIETHDAKTSGDWYITWDLSGVKTQIPKMEAQKRARAECIAKHILGEVSAEAVVELCREVPA